MKKLFITTGILISSLFALAQTPTFKINDADNSNAIVTDGTILSETTLAGQTNQHHFTITNLTAATVTLTVRKYEDLLNTVSVSDIASSVFCTGTNCYPPNVMNVSVTFTANQTMTFYADLTEASVVGASQVRYKIANPSNSNENSSFTLKYNGGITGINELLSASWSISSPFPNPAHDAVQFNINSKEFVTSLPIKVFNVLGSSVYIETSTLVPGQNTLKIDCQSFNKGIYYVRFGEGKGAILKKITIN
ncbi:MAG: T9SS type A sorting domain-containing protein [Bacteroidetes bacterium]|nr:T9SS type A sorting domain-containing protein [Bacteroidota bacterium]